MELTIKEENLVKSIRRLKQTKQGEDIFVLLHYIPFGEEGWITQEMQSEPAPLAATRSAMQNLLGDMKTRLMYNTSLVLVYYDSGVLRTLEFKKLSPQTPD